METTKSPLTSFITYDGWKDGHLHDQTGRGYTTEILKFTEKINAPWFIDQVLRFSSCFLEIRQIWTLRRIFVDNKPMPWFCLTMQDESGELIFAQSVTQNIPGVDTISAMVNNTLLMLVNEC